MILRKPFSVLKNADAIQRWIMVPFFQLVKAFLRV